MSKKRKLSEIDDDKYIQEIVSKKRKLTSLKDTDENYEQWQYICKAITESDLGGDLPDEVSGLIGDFSIGNWLECCVGRCTEKNSFLYENVYEGEYVKCFNCNTKLWFHWCEFHDHALTSIEEIGPHCSDCRKAICYPLIMICSGCCQWICASCVDDDNRCWDCANNNN